MTHLDDSARQPGWLARMVGRFQFWWLVNSPRQKAAQKKHRDASNFDHAWHVAINRHSDEQREAEKEWPRFMYDAKHASQEVKRLALLFEHERNGKLAKTFRWCSCCADSKHVVDNHLTCCLGTECRKCPHLVALEKAKLTAEQIDEAKAWTCVAHILVNGGDVMGEGFVTTVDDRMFWDGVHESLANPPEEETARDAPNIQRSETPARGRSL